MSITINDRRRLRAVGALAKGTEEMTKPDTVMVQPLTSYGEGAEIKHAHSPAYEVERPHAVELAANGFARMLDGRVRDEPAASVESLVEDGREDGMLEGKIENDGKPRGRRGART